MTNKPSANSELNADEQVFQIGKWTARPFSLQTAILLERIGSPFMNMKLNPETGKPMAIVPTLGEVAEALYIIINWDKPFINEVLQDELRFQNEVGNLTSQITMRDFAKVTQQLNAMMSALNTAVVESGIPDGDEKKEVTGPLES